MKELVTYIVKEITGSDKFSVEENEEGTTVNLIIKADPEIIGIIIGKGGATIKSIRNLLRVKSALTKTHFFLNVEENK